MRFLSTVKLFEQKLRPLYNGLVITAGGLNYKRKQMPQIAVAQLDSFLIWLKDQGITVIDDSTIDIKAIKPTQGEFNFEKIKNIMQNGVDDKKYIISNDYYLLDGHHTWLAGLNTDDEQEISVCMVDLDIFDLIATAHRYSGSFIRDLNEHFRMIGDI